MVSENKYKELEKKLEEALELLTKSKRRQGMLQAKIACYKNLLDDSVDTTVRSVYAALQDKEDKNGS